MRDITIDLADYDVKVLYRDTPIYSGENKASQLVITLNDEFIGYSYRLNFQLNSLTPYNTLALTAVDDVITYEITNVLTFVSGILRVELQAYDVDDTLIKSTAFALKVLPSIEGTPVQIPDEYATYLQLLEDGVFSVNTVLPVSGNVTLGTDNIEPSATRRYVPSVPVEPENKFLNGNDAFVMIEPPTGGYANNLYFGASASDVNLYKVLSYTPDIAETILNVNVQSSDGEKVVQNYLYPSSVGVDLFPSGLWSFTFYGKVDSTSGVTQIGVNYFKRSVLGVETDLFTQWSEEINNTTDGYIRFQITNPSYALTTTDRMGARIKVKTTRTSNVAVSFKVGDGYGAYLNNPNKIRHSQLRALDEANSHPASAISILDADDYFADATVELALKQTGLKIKGIYDDLPPFPILATTVGATAPTLATFKGNVKQYTFDATSDTVFGATEITHQYKEGTNLLPHIHWATNGLEAQNKYVKWELEYTIGTSNGAFSNAVAINTGELLISANTPDRTHKISDFGVINGSGLTIGTYICWILKRIVSVGDAPTSNPFAIALGFHVEQDTFGSVSVSSK